MKYFLLLLFFTSSFGFGQLKIIPTEGYSPHLGALVAMMVDLKYRITFNVKNLNQEQTDFLMDENANRIGALILHLAATEKYYQNVTFSNRTFTKEEKKIWETPLELGPKARKEFQGKTIEHYLKIWDEVRAESLRLLKEKNDDWLMEKFPHNESNNYWGWFHVMEHQANHMGQIAMILSRIPKDKN